MNYPNFVWILRVVDRLAEPIVLLSILRHGQLIRRQRKKERNKKKRKLESRAESSAEYLESDVEIEEGHGQVVRHQDVPQLKGFAVGMLHLALHHVAAAVKDDGQVDGGNGQCRPWRRHHRPIGHSRILQFNNSDNKARLTMIR
jgi:hypothetical protein